MAILTPAMNDLKPTSTVMVNFRVSPRHRDLLKAHADSLGISMTTLIRHWIEKFIRPLHR